MRMRCSNYSWFEVLIIVLAGILFAGIFSVIAAIPIYFLWNWLMPVIFGLTKITFWQAWGISWLSNLLFNRSSFSKKED